MWAQSPGTEKIAGSAMVVWLGIKFAAVFADTLTVPIQAWDSWSNWAVGGKLFYYSKSLMLDLPEHEFFGRAVQRHLAYPLLNPLMQVWTSLWAGGFDEILAKIWMPFFLLSLFLILFSIARRKINSLAALALCIVFLSSPLMMRHSVELYSDLPLGVYNLIALTSFMNFIEGRRMHGPLIGLFSAMALFTKVEALFFTLPLLLAACFYIWENGKFRESARKIYSLLFPMLIILPWYLFKIYYNISFGAVTFRPAFHPEILGSIISDFFSLSNFGIVFLLFPILLMAAKPTAKILYLLFPVVCLALFYISLYVFTADYYDHFLSQTIFYRNLLTYYPPVCLLSILLLSDLSKQVRASLSSAGCHTINKKEP
jgi:4-amino-4-deoxy-L-arabinose transferase-like glycosyltransferase